LEGRVTTELLDWKRLAAAEFSAGTMNDKTSLPRQPLNRLETQKKKFQRGVRRFAEKLLPYI